MELINKDFRFLISQCDHNSFPFQSSEWIDTSTNFDAGSWQFSPSFVESCDTNSSPASKRLYSRSSFL